MRPSFHPRLVNGPFDDPGLFVSFLFEKRAILFDCGDLNTLSPRDVLKISHVFVSHTHMDHFAGFDRLLRLLLGREKKLWLYGPEGFLKNIEGKLAGYTWNLVENYTNRFSLHATELGSGRFVRKVYTCRQGFKPERDTETGPFAETIVSEPAFEVRAAILDHGIPCIGYSLKERFHVNIVKDRLEDMGLSIGPWLKDFKTALFNGHDPDSLFEIPQAAGGCGKSYALGELAERIAIITPGQKFAYITDVLYSESNVKKIIELAADADHLFIEAAFINAERETAREKHHLTAHQAGRLAARARAKQFSIFHFSPRYVGMEDAVRLEAEESFRQYCR